MASFKMLDELLRNLTVLRVLSFQVILLTIILNGMLLKTLFEMADEV